METSGIDSEKQSQNILKLIQPELLSTEELVNILKERSVASNMLPQSKDELVSLFKSVALPLPQREFRQNYRGSLLTKLRKKAERRRISVSSGDEHKSYTYGANEATSSTKRPVERTCDRLKPPPGPVNNERKKIRLNSNNCQLSDVHSNSSSDLDKIVIKKRKPSESKDSVVEEKDSSTNHQPESERLSSENSKDKINDNCNGSKNSGSRKVSLKRNHLTSTSSSSSSEKTSEKSPSEPDKRRKPITWP